MAQQIILAPTANLRGRDLTNVYVMAKNHPDPETFAMFKKKEPLDNMAKSLLKFRIQALTGKSAVDIEEEMGFPSTRAGGGVPVEVLRRLAHYLILEASGHLAPPKEATPPKSSARKRGVSEVERSQEAKVPGTSEVGPQAKKARGRKSMAANMSQLNASAAEATPKRAGRRSMMPEMLQDMVTAVTDSVGCRLTPAKANTISSNTTADVEEEMEIDQPEEEVKVEDLGLGANPTPMMIAQKRRSLATVSRSTPVKKAVVKVVTPASAVNKKVVKEQPAAAEPILSPTSERRRLSRNLTAAQQTAVVQQQAVIAEAKTKSPAARAAATKTATSVAKVSPAASKSTKSAVNLASRQAGFPGAEESTIYLASGNPKELTYETVIQLAPEFEGANLTIVHTPVEWDPMDIFNLTKNIKKINSKANLDSFLVLVGCGIFNVHLLHDALKTQTKHVQFLVFERADQNLSDHKDGVKLREVTSYFLLAYFFPGCDKESSEPPQPMVRPGFTNYFQTKNVEDLENRISYVLTEQGDWILDLCCRNKGICLAAQKSGRSALAIDPSAEMLFSIKEKASAIAEHHSKEFRKNSDGFVQHF